MRPSVCILTLVISFEVAVSRIWNTSELIDEFVYNGAFKNIFDPTNFIPNGNKIKIQEQIDKIKPDIYCYLLVLESIEQRYVNLLTGVSNIKIFVTEFSTNFNKDSNFADSALYVLYDIETNDFAYEIGSTAVMGISEESLQKSIDTEVVFLYQGDNNKYFINFFDKMHDYSPAGFIVSEVLFDEDSWLLMIIILMVLLYCFGVDNIFKGFMSFFYIFRMHKRVQSLNKTDITLETVIRTHCTLCIDVNTAMTNSEQNLSNPDNVNLDCGHMFHKDCHEDWLLSNRTVLTAHIWSII